jgi:N-methylhydantoinase A/oxoprolinase/acetone carboxylase beta subunit
VELTALRIYVRIPVRRLDLRILERPYEDDGMRGLREAWFKDGWAETPIVGRAYFKRDRSLEGPLIVEEADTTIVIPPGWSVRRIEAACLLLRRMG